MNWSTSAATMVYDSSAFVNVTCCYHEITRTGSGRNADTEFKYVHLSLYVSGILIKLNRF